MSYDPKPCDNCGDSVEWTCAGLCVKCIKQNADELARLRTENERLREVLECPACGFTMESDV